MKTIWTEPVLVRTYQTDFQQQWKPSAFFSAMQEAGGSHADHLGVGYQALMAQHLVWVLARMRLQIFDAPRAGDKLTIETWPKGVQQKIFFLRDFYFYDSDQRVLAAASSAYLLIDTRTRRFVTSLALGSDLPDNDGRAAIAEPLEKLTPLSPLAPCLDVQAGYSRVDLVGHVNNAAYVDWITDCFPIELYRSSRLTDIQVNFTNEILPGEHVLLSAAQDPDDPSRWYLEGGNRSTSARAFEAQVRWKNTGLPNDAPR